jgi:hypothetical protein
VHVTSFSFTQTPSLPRPLRVRWQRCCLFSAATSTDKSVFTSSSSKSNNKNNKNTLPTARYLAVAALASGSKGSEIDPSAFASRRLDADVRYKQLESRDRAFAKLLVVRDLMLSNASSDCVSILIDFHCAISWIVKATVERRLGQIDNVLKSCIDKYPPKVSFNDSHLI